jgi:hypothetical protein
LGGLEQTEGARTLSIYATRFDAGDAYIVALPDKCLKLANNGYHLCDDSGYAVGVNYSVRLSYQGNATTAAVGDSGPWNVDDNYWAGVGDPQPRRLYPDLPAGMPEAQAAYFNDYNGGLDQFGRTVTAPFGIDLARQVSIDIGLQPGVNAWIEVTYLWTEGWDDIRSETALLTAPSSLTPHYTGDMCVTAWHRVTGYGDYAYLTLNVNAAGGSTNSGEWRPNLPSPGEYQVLAFVPDHPPIDWLCPEKTISRDTADASYTIQHAGGQATAGGDQGPLSNMWLDLGRYDFSAGSDGFVRLSDVTGEADFTHTVAFSAMLFRRLEYPTPTLPPPPTPTPTPTPTPQPFVWVGSGSAPPSSAITIPVGSSSLPLPGLGAAIIDLRYDPQILEAATCLPDPGDLFDSQGCDLYYERDGVNPDVLRLSLGSVSGVPSSPRLAEVVFLTRDAAGQISILEVNVQAFQYPGGGALAVLAYDGLVCIGPCRNLAYLPAVYRQPP